MFVIFIVIFGREDRAVIRNESQPPEQERLMVFEAPRRLAGNKRQL